MQKCIIDSTTKIVVNVIELEDGAVWSPPAGTELAPQHDGNMFDTWDGIQFIPPVYEIVPGQDLETMSGSAPNVIG
jgi:hypothetical protein